MGGMKRTSGKRQGKEIVSVSNYRVRSVDGTFVLLRERGTGDNYMYKKPGRSANKNELNVPERS